jgi:hypothetical protein
MLQFGGLPQWWPPSHALQWHEQPEPALVTDAGIVDQLLCGSDHPAGGSRVRNRGQLSTYDDFTIDRITLEIKESRPRSAMNAANAAPWAVSSGAVCRRLPELTVG